MPTRPEWPEYFPSNPAAFAGVGVATAPHPAAWPKVLADLGANADSLAKWLDEGPDVREAEELAAKELGGPYKAQPAPQAWRKHVGPYWHAEPEGEAPLLLHPAWSAPEGAECLLRVWENRPRDFRRTRPLVTEGRRTLPKKDPLVAVRAPS